MKSSLLRFLCCPRCGSDLAARPAEESEGEILGGTLACAGCAGEFPIERGVPRLFAEPLSGDVSRTADNFGFQWRKFSWLDPAYEGQFLDWIRPVGREFFAGKAVLDAGCGKGRHLVWAQSYGARHVVGIDMSDAVQVAYAHTRHLRNVHVIQGDLCRPPLRRAFDYAYSLGVLHHMPEPERGIRSLGRLVVPGGRASLWVYGRENNGWIVNIVNPLRTAVTSRLGSLGQRAVSLALTALVLWPLLVLVVRPLGRLFPSFVDSLFYGQYLRYISRFSFKDVRAIVFDHLSPPIAHYVRRGQLEGWIAAAGLELEELEHHNKNSWRALARVPA